MTSQGVGRVVAPGVLGEKMHGWCPDEGVVVWVWRRSQPA